MDKIDKQILAILQEDATVAVADIAERVNLSSTPCWRRIQKLEEEGYLLRRVALLDAEKLNVGVTVFVSIKTNQHNAAWYEQFSATVKLIPEVVEFYRMSGNIDYLLRVVVPNIAAYDKVYQKLTQANALFDVNASFAMEQIKHTTALPLDYADIH
ncbi:Lrp/AsnC family transcriptional regulator [Glaciimonas soli]|uniref:Winged helix-turn-helix transcriptional regulator n=1 Tax=Glaciimonas soli TaxID=2590999 RepID=A0A843YPT4_9BURK|nr:Lrp/AsnC family transcriptional regulator [Glaciimonas soli]MQQ99400.1 winged helix-turn-helix transcriptional regulator [Glaciimonas soli]